MDPLAGHSTAVFLQHVLGQLSIPGILADGLSPVLWTDDASLLIGNAIIGFCEGILLILVFRTKWRAVPFMILANCLSMFSGRYLIAWMRMEDMTNLTIDNIIIFLVLALILSWVLTVGLEWPFCWLSLGTRDGRKRKALWASLIVNAASYAVLVPIYIHQSNGIRLLPIDPACLVDAPSDLCVYYLSNDGGGLWRVECTGGRPEKVLDLGVTASRLHPLPAENGHGFDLWTETFGGEDRLVMANAGEEVGLTPHDRYGDAAMLEWHRARTTQPTLLPPYMRAAAMSDAEGTPWEVFAGFRGLIAKNKRTMEKVVVGLATPFLYWGGGHATVLQGEKVVFEFGHDQIILVDLRTRKMTLLAMGHSPVVATTRPARN